MRHIRAWVSSRIVYSLILNRHPVPRSSVTAGVLADRVRAADCLPLPPPLCWCSYCLSAGLVPVWSCRVPIVDTCARSGRDVRLFCWCSVPLARAAGGERFAGLSRGCEGWVDEIFSVAYSVVRSTALFGEAIKTAHPPPGISADHCRYIRADITRDCLYIQTA